jgi:SAM-dependent methyltransferase
MTCLSVRSFIASSLLVSTPRGHVQADAVPGFLREVARILRPGGLFLSADWDTHPALHPEHPWFLDLEDYMPQTITFYDHASYVLASFCHWASVYRNLGCRTIVPTLAPDIPTLIHENGSFERPVLKRRAIPISEPHAPGSNGLHFVSEVMKRVTQGYADALVAGRRVPLDIADNFKAELSWRSGIVCIYQTVFARKSPN